MISCKNSAMTVRTTPSWLAKTKLGRMHPRTREDLDQTILIPLIIAFFGENEDTLLQTFDVSSK